MRIVCLLLGFSVITSLIANEEDKHLAKFYEDKAPVQECTPKCAPCCPTPPEPICSVSYLPNYNDLQCDSGFFIYGDFLYWFANEDNLSPCMTVQGTNTSIQQPATPTTTTGGGTSIVPAFFFDTLNLKKVNHLNSKWDPGFRAAIGYNFEHDGWDLEVNYTWYHNKKHRTFSVPGFQVVEIENGATANLFPGNGQLALVDPWINTSIYDFHPNVGPFLFEKVSSIWKLHFNQLDLALGKKFWISQFMAMRSFVGARGGYFSTRFTNVASSFSGAFFYHVNNFSDQFKDRYWGVGLLAGIQPEWHFTRNFILFSNIDGSLLWGKFKVNKKEDYTSFDMFGVNSVNHHTNANSRFMKMQAVFDLALGFRWEETWCYRIRTALDIGWENHIWFDDNHRFKTESSSPKTTPGGSIPFGNGVHEIKIQSYEEEQGNLMLGGAFIRFRIDF